MNKEILTFGGIGDTASDNPFRFRKSLLERI